MRILGIESSCDDTSVSLIEASDEEFFVIAEKTASQIDIHKKYGGVVPEVAARAHAEYIVPLIEEVMDGSPSTEAQGKPNVIAVTSGPGLMTALLVGVEAARSLSYAWNVPLIAVNHIDGHIHSVQIKNQLIEFPALCLVVSGGHTELLLTKEHGVYKKIGHTVDDAAGECFDKVAKLLGLDYPGGPKISQFAIAGDTNAIPFPRPMIHEDNFDFSFAGLKTAALYWLRDNHLTPPSPSHVRLSSASSDPEHVEGSSVPKPTRGGNISRADFCASLEQAIVDVLVTKTINATKKYKPRTIVLGGGVAANKKLREMLQQGANSLGIQLLAPELKYSMDNATMIAVAGYYTAKRGEFTHWKELKADPQWELD